MKILARLLILVLPLLPIATSAQQESGWSNFGSALGGGIDRESAYMEGFLQGLERENQRMEAENRARELEQIRLDNQIRSLLTDWWEHSGFDRVEALKIASAYEYSPSIDAIIAGVRRNGSLSAVAPMKSALEAYDYLRANHILLAYIFVSTEENKAAANE